MLMILIPPLVVMRIWLSTKLHFTSVFARMATLMSGTLRHYYGYLALLHTHDYAPHLLV